LAQQNQLNASAAASAGGPVRLHRTLGLWNLIIIGMVIVQPTAPMGIYGVISNKAHGHVVTTIFIAMVAMLFTAIGYGRMSRVYPSAGSAYTYVGQEIHSALGYIVGWGMVMAYLLNPLICTAFCAKAAMNILPGLPYYVWILFFAGFFTWTNLRGIKTSARLNEALCAGMVVVVLLFLGCVIHAVWGIQHDPGYFTHPFYEAANFHLRYLLAVLPSPCSPILALTPSPRSRRRLRIPAVILCWPRFWSVLLPAFSPDWRSTRRNSSGDRSRSPAVRSSRPLPWCLARPAA